ncbi:hypothetical protein DFH05DRAFT_263245 [Lentinula detonsa]|uniref:Uncharacterized protein n=1 Tax=Lentinula detonsa TaxID=2804962 RepID=A0A9W8NVX7_9AGAR|nr:hypothetical protein DFH05DRAFT_263245 [Lentinula detonsa]
MPRPRLKDIARSRIASMTSRGVFRSPGSAFRWLFLLAFTFIALLEDVCIIIVQLKHNEIHLTKVAFTRALPGNIVPSMHETKTERAYFTLNHTLTHSQEEMWAAKDDSGQPTTSGIVEYNIVHRLHKLWRRKIPFRDFIFVP